MDLDNPRWGVIGVVFAVILAVASFTVGLITPVSPLVATIVFIIFLFLLVVAYLKLRTLKQVAYKVISSTTALRVEAVKEIQDKVKIFLYDKPIWDASNVTLRIWNSGNEPIQIEDYNSPIIIDFGEGVEVLNVTEEINPNDLDVDIQVNTRSLFLKIAPLKKSNSIVFDVLLSGYEGELKVEGDIEGVKKIVNWDETLTSKVLSSELIGCLIFAVSMLLIIALIFLLTKIFTFSNSSSCSYLEILGFKLPIWC
jgi:hypothetical protein